MYATSCSAASSSHAAAAEVHRYVLKCTRLVIAAPYNIAGPVHADVSRPQRLHKHRRLLTHKHKLRDGAHNVHAVQTTNKEEVEAAVAMGATVISVTGIQVRSGARFTPLQCIMSLLRDRPLRCIASCCDLASAS
jgi:hypothetical protein